MRPNPILTPLYTAYSTTKVQGPSTTKGQGPSTGAGRGWACQHGPPRAWWTGEQCSVAQLSEVRLRLRRRLRVKG